MPDLQFESEIDSFVAEFVSQAEAFAPNIAAQMLEEIIDSGPYWSGRSRASWNASVGAPNLAIPGFDGEGGIPKKAGAISEQEAKQRSMATLANIQGATLGQTIFIANGNPYIEAINAGHSPGHKGWVDAAVNHYLGTANIDIFY